MNGSTSHRFGLDPICENAPKTYAIVLSISKTRPAMGHDRACTNQQSKDIARYASELQSLDRLALAESLQGV